MMMATAEPPSSSSFLPLLESLEDSAAGQSEQTDAYLTIANRLSGEEGRQFLPAVEKHFPRLGKAILAHINSPTAELSQAALQALGFCLYHSHVVSAVPETFAAEILSALCSLVVKSTDKNTCTRALWVISKQSFPPGVVGPKVSPILGTLESVWSREDIQSVVMEHEALNVIIRMLEQAPAQMGDGALRWAKLIIPLVVHSASKVRLRAAAAMEMGMPLLLEKQMEVAGIMEPMMSSKLIPELQKLFMSKNEANVLKLWPLFVKLLGKLLHRGGPFINSLLHLEELGFRSSSPTIKKIAFIAWKSLIDNFALNPDILCSAKRMKLLMQPLASINVRTEVLLLTKVEVWWYLVVQLGPNLAPNFDQVSVPLLHCTIGSDSSSVPGTPSRAVTQNGAVTPGTPMSAGFNSPANTSRMSLNSSVQIPSTFPSIQLLGLEMLLHYFLGPDVIATAAKKKLILSLEPLNHPLLSGASSFTKHAAILTSNIRDGFINVGKEAPDALLAVLWTSLVRFVNLTIESGSKKDRQGGEVLTLMLQALQSIVASEALPADKVLILFEATVKGIPQRVLGSASYQVGKMDVLNGTPALFLILLLYNSSLISAYIEDERFFQSLQTLVGCGLSGPTSPLAFGEAVLAAIRRSAGSVQNKEQLWRMWSVMVSPLTDTITQSNEVNQGDALEHNFSAINSALLFPITHLLHGTPLQQAAHKSMLSSWSKLYKVFARCSALVVTAEENICCEELCAKMTAAIDKDALKVPSTLNAVACILQVMVECVDFSPFTPQFQQKMKSPHTPVNWTRKRNKVLGNLSTFQSLLVQCLEVYLEGPESPSEATGAALVSILSALFTNLALANTIKEALTSLVRPLTLFYKQAASEPSKFSSQLQAKLEKLLCDVLGCLQTRSALAYDDALLALLSPLLCVAFPHKNKQLRGSVAQFWNATFGNSVSLTYPDEIRPILSQVKQKTPIILPGFEVVSVPDELSGHYSSESSQMESNLSGMPVSSVGKRDSLLKKAAELKDSSSVKASKSVSTKLDFGSPKPPPRGVLEEEASIDFVFIPPETKERVLTEHQKEVKRTKRVDIPAMYNNLDASLDTTVFTQYTQSQEDSLDKLATEQADKVTKEAPGKVPQEVEIEDSEETQDFASPEALENMQENQQQQEEIIPESADVSMEDKAKSDDPAEDMDLQSTEGTSPNISGSSDLVTGTPQKPNSRRQSFITLEKYAEGKPASPSSSSSFTGPLIKTSNSQERSKASKKSSARASRTSTGPHSQDSQSSQTGSMNSQYPVNNPLDSPVRPKDSMTKSEPVRLTERLPSDPTEDEDLIPDTQTEVEGNEGTQLATSSEEIQKSSQEEESEPSLDDSQSSPGEPRRSGRYRVKPLLPGEDPEERDEKYTLSKRRRSGEELKGDSPKSSSAQNRRNTRSMQAAEEDSGLRTRSQRDKRESSQTNSQGRSNKKIKLFSSSQDFLDKPESKRRSSSVRESSQTDLPSDNESQSQGKQRRRSKASLETKEDAEMKKKVLPDKEESSQTAKHDLVELSKKDEDKPKTDSKAITPSPPTGGKSQEYEIVEQTVKDGDKQNRDSETITPSPETGVKSQEFELVEPTEKDCDKQKGSQTITPSPQTGGTSQEFEIVEQAEKDDFKQNKDSQIITSSSQTGDLSQESERLEKTNKDEIDSQIVAAPPASDESQDGTNKSKKLVNKSEDKDKPITSESTDDNLSQEDSQVITPSSSESQSLRRSRRSKASSEEAESQDKSENKDSLDRKRRSNSQPEARIGGRTRRSMVQEEQSKSSPTATPESSQSLEPAGSSESSKGRGRYSRRSSPALPAAAKESSESESSEVKENLPVPKKRGRKPRASLPSPLTIESKEGKMNKSMVKDDSDTSQKADSQSIEAKTTTDLEDSQASQDLQDSESLQVTCNAEEQSNEESPMEVEVEVEVEVEGEAAVEKTETEDLKKIESPSVSPLKEQTQEDSNVENTSSQEGDTGDLPSADLPESVGTSSEQTDEKLPCDPSVSSAEDELAPPDGTTEKLQVSEPSEEKAEEVFEESGDNVTGKQQDDSDSTHQEDPVVPVEDRAEDVHDASFGQTPVECPTSSKDEEPSASDNEDDSTTQKAEANAGDDVITPLQESDKDDKAQTAECNDEEETAECNDGEETAERNDGEETAECNDEEETAECNDEEETAERNDGEETAECNDEEETAECNDGEETQTADAENDVVVNLDAALADVGNASEFTESTSKDVFSDSPAKQKDLEALMAADVGESPSSGRTRGTWSPSASPSTSILKKGLKRPLEEETTSPLVKSRRVSFADPIQHQELADDIDRRSPAVRTSSPRRSKVSGIPQPKYVTTPTKGLLILSPRNLHSPGYKSSKKCLISEMSQEPRPVSRDCIYPALVGCSTPVEAVLPQISSNMWSRGFGQLVRARNIKTVGDLSALTPSEIKTLPIRSPKISNVKKALRSYEQQRKGRGVDELKSFDETEMMTSELEENAAPQNQDEEDKTSGETLATELLDEPVPADERPEQDGSGNQTPDTPTGEHEPVERLHPEGRLQSEVEVLSGRMTPLELSYCSSQQLVQMHDRLGGLMRSVVVELQTRLCQTEGRPRRARSPTQVLKD
ncbi:telomere-associated protein RIF1 isoform X3 [Anoplopoma fimbria]|uniref:telomere-associated protein RIF1 isoform X3 n=1 Tax=Anoplopoma fimbria TaxID=229290 RepID=UPI0023ECC6E9|nr:telomere-associated protein RIF1 isoform X3 [Anoplopoma fimbria]